jgi:uncharacterized membrane-anchored protein
MQTFSRLKFALVTVAAMTIAASSLAQDKGSKADLKIIQGPADAPLEKVAHITVPTGYSFLDGKTTRALMKASGEPVSGQEMGLISPTNEHWTVIFEFSDDGYVKDDDKNKLDADKILASIKRGTAEQNKQRVKNGNAPLEIVGWEQPPKYDETTHNLEWAIRATSEGKPILNYNTRLLGRKGVMEVVLIVEPDKLAETLPAFRNLLAGYSFQTGQTYAEYRQGDKVAKYGLAALVVGGAAAGAVKLGLFSGLILFLKKGWKLVVIGVAAIATVFKKFFARIFGGKSQSVG